ncbi:MULTISPECIES: DUF3427 domain-containing protein [unclassified Corynebacterium]|uniref:DUF3427 domain-containing protein n=1 Tax=unclassified Corynebacterium TaxID=2624378 RepID=UPI00264FEA47|nr:MULTISPECIES: DEAD/DEAH box helicase [unclassified Corynebacterium]MDN8594833.1 DEAD/DEAH box helicase [Corynebacterium sp. P4_F2]WKK56319.1 DEAD/DEAH box helicase [Corynebacterium sp. P4-C1]WKK63752.1 DEAD/DEAH box helicase [Corynebacterium sp. P8-C1]
MSTAHSLRSLEADTFFGYIDRQTLSERIHNPSLVANADDNTMLAALRAELKSSKSFTISVAFVTNGGIGALKEALVDFRGRGMIITSDYQDFNSPDALRELLRLRNIDVRIMSGRSHHAKGYVFDHGDHVTALVGSSNLTRDALMDNSEWNLKFSTHHDGDIADQLNAALQRHIETSEPLTEKWIQAYSNRRRPPVFPTTADEIQPGERAPQTKILPNKMQTEALDRLRALIESGENRALIISATGTGKTILAGLAAREFKPERVLFVAHTAQILRKAATEFQRVFETSNEDTGFFIGQQREMGRRFTFATVQSISRIEHLAEISPKQFDYIIIDEVHRSGAASYRRIIDHFRPSFLLGLTATPERTDGFNVYELFDHNVPFEIRLGDALESRMLVPFDYYGVSDYESMNGYTISDDSTIAEKVARERIEHLVQVLEDYSFPSGTKGLIFCSSNKEARRLSQELNKYTLYGKPLRTVSLSGADSIHLREDTVEKLQAGELDFIITVDIFNEGIDIPDVNVIMMLRSTKSSIIFTQQLGRGLRKATFKETLRVIDVIGNYSNNYLIPIALTGDRSGDPDSARETIRRSRTHPVAGSSTISFDEVTTERILESIKRANLIDKRKCKEAILNLEYRLGQLPRLVDFETHESINPFLMASKYKNYWSLLHSLKFVEVGPSKKEQGFLNMLSAILLSGKRPQELLLLQLLCESGSLPVGEYVEFLKQKNLDHSNACLDSVERVLNLQWFTDGQRSTFGNRPLAERHNDVFRLSDDFQMLYDSYALSESFSPVSFRDHVDDIVETGLLLNRKNFASGDRLIQGKRYSRRDACRLLNWSDNQESTVYGYKTDKATMTCPIFVTYHKDAKISESIRYEDTLIDRSTLHWFTRNRRTLKSNELQPILNGDADLHLFAKREDAEGAEFYYLGQADSTNPQQTEMLGKNNKPVDVVTTNLKLRVPLPAELFDSLTARKTVAAENRH